jgi:hypothetical protein
MRRRELRRRARIGDGSVVGKGRRARDAGPRRGEAAGRGGGRLQREWLRRCATTWHHFNRKAPLAHYGASRTSSTARADLLIAKIDPVVPARTGDNKRAYVTTTAPRLRLTTLRCPRRHTSDGDQCQLPPKVTIDVVGALLRCSIGRRVQPGQMAQSDRRGEFSERAGDA